MACVGVLGGVLLESSQRSAGPQLCCCRSCYRAASTLSGSGCPLLLWQCRSARTQARVNNAALGLRDLARTNEKILNNGLIYADINSFLYNGMV
ncbi:hypothetical protein AALP_AA3G211900 [Arabis alpina]|uniref:Uncharacterized protein n=1 Tax=Arabis alpina TaxID=50452 RepID=A0A087HAP1_ARAAL|nr:hypothetical protein AALP_AA3G211900 [Arabis alpina]